MIINWNTDEKYMKKHSLEAYKRWRVVQVISYGGEKLNEAEVKAYWPQIKDELDIDTKKAIEFLLWGKRWKKEPGLRPDRQNFLDWWVKRRNLHLSSI